MYRRAIVLATLAVLVCASSGMARDDGRYVHQDLIDFPLFDSTQVVGAWEEGVSMINDSLFFAFTPFQYDGPWSDLLVRFSPHTIDTSTTTGLSHDSVKFYLQTKLDQDSSRWWHTVGATGQIALKSFDSTGYGGDTLIGDAPLWKTAAAVTGVGWANRANIAATHIHFAMSDSVIAHGEVFRIVAEYHAEEDSLQNHCTYRSSSQIDIMEKLWMVAMFHLR